MIAACTRKNRLAATMLCNVHCYILSTLDTINAMLKGRVRAINSLINITYFNTEDDYLFYISFYNTLIYDVN